MNVEMFQVDAFTDTPFTGNPAGVFLLSELQADSWMRQVAQEMNLSEVAFLLPLSDGYSLRWFTPTTEVDLCGHATLAAAHILWQEGLLAPEETAIFHTKSGVLRGSKRGDWIELDFPIEPAVTAEPPEQLLAALGVLPTYVGRNRFDYIVELGSEEELQQLNPDLALLADLPVRGVIVTCLSSAQGVDFVSRFFGPAIGIDEDPVTGSAHCCLAPYWSRRLGKEVMTARQLSPRGGALRVRLGQGRVYLQGQAVTVIRGQLLA